MNIFKFFRLFTMCVVLLGNCLIANHASSKDFKFKRLTNLQQQGVGVSVLAVRLKDGQILAQLSPDEHLIPASTTKLVTAAKTLETWGPNKTFSTTVLRRGEIKNGILAGDLIFYGGGDPSLINEQLTIFIQDIVKIGIKRVTGKLIVNNSLFGTITQDSTRAQTHARAVHAYDSPLSAAAVNYSLFGCVVNPGPRVGKKANISFELPGLSSISIVNNVKTTSKKSKTWLKMTGINTKNNKSLYTITGNIALNDVDRHVYTSVMDPDMYAGKVMLAHLQNAGIQIDHTNIEIDSTPLRKTDTIIAKFNGYTLQEQLQPLLKFSNNFIADKLLLNLAAEDMKNNIFSKKSNAFNLQNASDILQTYMRLITDDNKIIIKSGSGLTPENRISANNFIRLLQRIYNVTDHFNIIFQSLAIPSEIGSLHGRFKKLSDQTNSVLFAAKTGTLNQPYPVVSLAGYAKTRTDDWIAFAMIVNGVNSGKYSVYDLRVAIDNDLTDFLESGLDL